MMRRILVLAALAVGVLAPAARADTVPSCTRYGSGAPYIDYVTGGGGGAEPAQIVLQAGGDVGNCAPNTGVQFSLSIQHYESGAWVTYQTFSTQKYFALSWRFARQAGGNVFAYCQPGAWRSTVTFTVFRNTYVTGVGWVTTYNAPVTTVSGTATYTCQEISGAP